MLGLNKEVSDMISDYTDDYIEMTKETGTSGMKSIGGSYGSGSFARDGVGVYTDDNPYVAPYDHTVVVDDLQQGWVDDLGGGMTTLGEGLGDITAGLTNFKPFKTESSFKLDTKGLMILAGVILGGFFLITKMKKK